MNGIFWGQWKRRLGRRVLIRDCGQTHVAGIAPTRSGKGANMVIPTLLTWPDSVCVLDLKGENYQRSAGRRKQLGNVILKFDPTSENSSRFNPFDEIDMHSADRIGDIDNIATSLLDPRGKGTVMDSRLTQHLSQHTTLNQRMELVRQPRQGQHPPRHYHHHQAGRTTQDRADHGQDYRISRYREGRALKRAPRRSTSPICKEANLNRSIHT